MTKKESHTCKACGHEGAGKYCSQCGQPYELKKISLKSFFLEIIQSFTNVEKGFWYTFKQLVLRPGHMQWEYIHKNRTSYQKPFSFMLICATAAALVRFWIFDVTSSVDVDSSMSEAFFFREYWTFTHLALMPLYILITYLVFKTSGYNYAEIGVMVIYLFSILFVVSALITFLRFIWPEVDSVWFELPIMFALVILTCLNFSDYNGLRSRSRRPSSEAAKSRFCNQS